MRSTFLLNCICMQFNVTSCERFMCYNWAINPPKEASRTA